MKTIKAILTIYAILAIFTLYTITHAEPNMEQMNGSSVAIVIGIILITSILLWRVAVESRKEAQRKHERDREFRRIENHHEGYKEDQDLFIGSN